MSFFAPIIAGVGSLFSKAAIGAGAKAVLGSVAGGAINRHFNRAGQRDSFEYMESKGLTPQEIAGSGAAGQGSSGVGNVLGNQAAELERIRRQQQYDEKQRNMDRQIALRGQDMGLKQTQTAANASITSSALSAGASNYASDQSADIARMNNALARDTYQNITLPAALRNAVTQAPAWERARIMAQMGVDNMIGTAIGNKYGLNPMDPRALSSMSDSDFRKMVTEIYGVQSRIFGESAGAATVIGNGMSEIGAAATGTGR